MDGIPKMKRDNQFVNDVLNAILSDFDVMPSQYAIVDAVMRATYRKAYELGFDDGNEVGFEAGVAAGQADY
jgi:cell division septal protein FtsQ